MSRPLPLRRPLALCGEVGGHRRTYLLGPGLNRIGSRLDGDVVLALPGVSRRHALLYVEPGRLSLEDLGSKNGTWVNGRREESAQVEVGDRLRFGPVSLRLEELPAVDGELAIPGVSAGAPRRLPESTQAAPSELEGRPAAGLAELAVLADRLPQSPGSSPVEALSYLAQRLGADGAALLEADAEDRPVVLSCSGEPPGEDALTAAFGDAQAGGIASARLADAGGRTRVLVAWGDLAGGEEHVPFLRLALRLLDPLLQPELAAPSALRTRLAVPDGWVRGDSPAMRALLRQMESVAGSDLPILILGETGTGKEGIARILHGSSPRRRGPFVALNCAAIPRELLEAELFGVGRGVATGVSPRPGHFQRAHGGTLFLDEVGDTPADIQAKLLRALEEREVQPLGGAPVAVDARVLAATNAGLDERVRDGSFRADLFYRLAGCVLRVPPLRERREDVPVLVEHFLRAAAREAGKSVRGVSLGALRRLVDMPWPGNVRELGHAVRRLVWLCADSEAIVAETLDLAGLSAGTGEDAGAAEPGLPPDLDLAALERRAVAEALRRCGGNQSRAADLLGITRTALYRRMRRYGLLQPPS